MGGGQCACLTRLCMGKNYADLRYFFETCYGPSVLGSLEETRLFYAGEEVAQPLTAVHRKKVDLFDCM